MIVTEELKRRIPLFSELTVGETVDIPDGDIELLTYKSCNGLSNAEIRHRIERMAYYGLNTRAICAELVWYDPTIWDCDHIRDDLPICLRNELQTYYPGSCNAIVRCDRNAIHDSMDVANAGALRLLKWLHNTNSLQYSSSLIECAADSGNLAMVKWLVKLFGPIAIQERVYIMAIRRGHMQILKWLMKQKPYRDSELCSFATIYGHLKILKFLYGNGCPWDEYHTIYNAAYGGHFEMVKWVVSKGCQINADIINIAAASGHFEIVKWMLSKGYVGNDFTCGSAAKSGNIEMVAWLYAQNYSLMDACARAAGKGHLDMIKWLCDRGAVCDTDTCAMAASSGKLEILQWLRERDCPWDSQTLFMASYNDKLDILIWAYENGCPHDHHLASLIAYHGNIETIKWACENICEWDLEMCLSAAEDDNVHVFEWAYNEGYKFTDEMIDRISGCSYKLHHWVKRIFPDHH